MGTQENTGQKMSAQPQYHDTITRSHQEVYLHIIQHSMHGTLAALQKHPHALHAPHVLHDILTPMASYA